MHAAVDDEAHHRVALDALVADAPRTGRVVRLAEERHLADRLDAEHARAQPVVDVVVVVGDLVHVVDELRLERGRLARQVLGGSVGVRVGAVLDDALAHLPGQVQPRELRIAPLEHLQDPQRLAVVLEAAVVAHQLVHHALAGVPERRVAEVVPEHQALRELLVEPHRARDAPADLGAFEAVREARPVVVALVVDEDLGLVLEAPERGAVDDAVAVPLEAGPHRVLGLRIGAAAARDAPHAPGSELRRLARFLGLAIHERHAGLRSNRSYAGAELEHVVDHGALGLGQREPARVQRHDRVDRAHLRVGVRVEGFGHDRRPHGGRGLAHPHVDADLAVLGAGVDPDHRDHRALERRRLAARDQRGDPEAQAAPGPPSRSECLPRW